MCTRPSASGAMRSDSRKPSSVSAPDADANADADTAAICAKLQSAKTKTRARSRLAVAIIFARASSLSRRWCLWLVRARGQDPIFNFLHFFFFS